jgi:hypothetical protein
MSDQQSPHESGDPNDLQDLDPQQFVGDAPAGDATPGEFLSSDQSSHDPATDQATDTSDASDDTDPDHQEDA